MKFQFSVGFVEDSERVREQKSRLKHKQCFTKGRFSQTAPKQLLAFYRA